MMSINVNTICHLELVDLESPLSLMPFKKGAFLSLIRILIISHLRLSVLLIDAHLAESLCSD